MLDFIDWVGRVSEALWLITLILGGAAWARGILPVVWRLGNGLSKRKIAIFADSTGQDLPVLRSLLSSSKLFQQKNIIEIGAQKTLDDAKPATLYLISWQDYQTTIDGIIDKKAPGTAVVVYAAPGSIPPDRMKLLDSKPGVVVANFRGRMLNDILVCLMTTGYQ
jgi:hypothetical protein